MVDEKPKPPSQRFYVVILAMFFVAIISSLVSSNLVAIPQQIIFVHEGILGQRQVVARACPPYPSREPIDEEWIPSDTTAWPVLCQRLNEIAGYDFSQDNRLDATVEGGGGDIQQFLDDQNMEQSNILTKEFVQQHASETNYVTITWANYAYLGLLMSWIYHVEQAGVNNYILGAMDKKLLADLLARQLPTFVLYDLEEEGNSNVLGWGSSGFHAMGRLKTKLIDDIVQMGFNVIVADTDTTWLRDPIPMFERYPHADILTSSDSVIHHSVESPESEEIDEQYRLEAYDNAWPEFNIGIMMFRPSCQEMTKDWRERLINDSTLWDQGLFNQMAREGMSEEHPDQSMGLFWAFNKTLTLGVLPLQNYASGHTYFIQHLARKAHQQASVAHADFQPQGEPGKIHRLREYLVYHDPPSYFDESAKYLTWTMDLPPELLKNARPQTYDLTVENIPGHFAVINHQLKQIRTAFALGRLFNRTVVFPPLWCGLDRFHAPHTGTIPPAQLQFPFICPLDHILDLQWITSEYFDESRFGPKPEFREFSFFFNPRLPASLKYSRVNIQVCDESNEGCATTRAGEVGSADEPTVPTKGKHWLDLDLANVTSKPKLTNVTIAKNQWSNELEQALSEYSEEPVWEFESLIDLYNGFVNSTEEEQFQNMMMYTGGTWCCVQVPEGEHGHVWYDLQWDLIPHKDRHNREFNEAWTPLLGP